MLQPEATQNSFTTAPCCMGFSSKRIPNGAPQYAVVEDLKQCPQQTQATLQIQDWTSISMLKSEFCMIDS
jgi:hypothetical protein